MAWTWRFEKADGTAAAPAVAPADLASPADAEAWIGDHWRSLLEGGADQVTLLDDGKEVYTMSLHAPGGS